MAEKWISTCLQVEDLARYPYNIKHAQGGNA